MCGRSEKSLPFRQNALKTQTEFQNKSLYNSSLTRVYPLFGRLISQDPTGHSWLPAILQLAYGTDPQPFPLPENIGSLLPDLVIKHSISGNALKYHGVDSIDLPRCFEKSIPPSYSFLRWLIEHPERLTWPDHGKARFSARTQNKREDLLGWRGIDRQVIAQHEALNALEQTGAKRSQGKWWAFEGTTSVDCYLETENILLLIEGKRTEPLSASVNWYPGRNQLVRNLEVAQELAGDKPFAVLLIAEDNFDPLTPGIINISLPHFSSEERQTLMQHYLGCLTWRQVCDSVGVPYESLPDTVPDWIASQ